MSLSNMRIQTAKLLSPKLKHLTLVGQDEHGDYLFKGTPEDWDKAI